MKTTIYDVDQVLRELFSLGENAINSPFVKNFVNAYGCGPDCACTDEDAVAGYLSTQVKTYDDKYVFVAEVPGLSEDNLTLEYKEGVLILKAKYEKQEGDAFKYLRTGTWIGSFKAKDIDETAINAKLDSGQLFVTLPKKAEAQPIKVTINK
jgi:HSP20 family molecular chaperone IbpA